MYPSMTSRILFNCLSDMQVRGMKREGARLNNNMVDVYIWKRIPNLGLQIIPGFSQFPVYSVQLQFCSHPAPYTVWTLYELFYPKRWANNLCVCAWVFCKCVFPLCLFLSLCLVSISFCLSLSLSTIACMLVHFRVLMCVTVVRCPIHNLLCVFLCVCVFAV